MRFHYTKNIGKEINMADEKKRYWLKLEKDFLDSKYIKIIKGVPNGTDYILFYLALMLASVDSVGHLRFTELVAYNEQMLASLTGTNIDIVRSAMKLFQELGMIRILEDGTIFMPEVPRLTGKESESAERVRAFRERKRQELLNCNNDVTECNDNKEKEEEKQRTDNKEQIYTRLLEKWNTLGLVKHTEQVVQSKWKNKHTEQVKLYGEEKVFKAMENYATIIHSPSYFFDYKWPLWDFIARGLDKFVDDVSPLENFRIKKGEQKQEQKPDYMKGIKEV